MAPSLGKARPLGPATSTSSPPAFWPSYCGWRGGKGWRKDSLQRLEVLATLRKEDTSPAQKRCLQEAFPDPSLGIPGLTYLGPFCTIIASVSSSPHRQAVHSHCGATALCLGSIPTLFLSTCSLSATCLVLRTQITKGLPFPERLSRAAALSLHAWGQGWNPGPCACSGSAPPPLSQTPGRAGPFEHLMCRIYVILTIALGRR